MPSSSARAGALATSLVVLAAFIPTKGDAQGGYSAPRNADVDAAGARSARIEARAGSLRVEGHPGITRVRVRGTARSSHRDRLDDIRLIAERRGSEVFIKADIPDRSGSIGLFTRSSFDALDLVIEVPVAMALDVDDGSGEAMFLNTGPLTLGDGSGSVEIRGARGDVRVTDGSGEIVIDGVEGSVTLSDGSGEIRVRNVTGDVTVLEDGSGGMDIAGVGGTVRVENDGSGSIDVGRVAGDLVVARDGGGTIRYDTVKGSVSIPDRKRRR